MIVLGIETSCDETAASVVEAKNKNKKILSNILYSQFKEHKDYGGVVPEIAFREHLKLIDKIILRALKKAKKEFKEIDVIAATGGPGLHGGLLIGTTIAKSISLSIDKPFIPINHLEAHLLSPTFNNCISLTLTWVQVKLILFQESNVMWNNIALTLTIHLNSKLPKTVKM